MLKLAAGLALGIAGALCYFYNKKPDVVIEGDIIGGREHAIYWNKEGKLTIRGTIYAPGASAFGRTCLS